MKTSLNWLFTIVLTGGFTVNHSAAIDINPSTLGEYKEGDAGGDLPHASNIDHTRWYQSFNPEPGQDIRLGETMMGTYWIGVEREISRVDIGSHFALEEGQVTGNAIGVNSARQGGVCGSACEMSHTTASLPTEAWLFVLGLIGLAGVARKFHQA